MTEDIKTVIKQLIADGTIDKITDEAFLEQFGISKEEARAEIEE